MFSDHINLEISNKRYEKSPNIWKLNSTLLNNLLVKEEMRQKKKISIKNETVNHKKYMRK